MDCAGDGERADFLGQTEVYDAVILDLGLPKLDGLTVLRRWRDAGVSVPVLVLTARDSWHEKVRGIDGGADDYVAKPFRMEEVLARLRALIRRSSGQSSAEIRCGAIALDTRGARVTVDSRPVRLTSHEFRVLSYLMHHRSRVVSQSELTEHIYPLDSERDSNTVEVFIAEASAQAGGNSHRNRPRSRLSHGRRETMRLALSLRTRLLLGTALWTLGLFVVTGTVTTVLMLRYPSTPRLLHGMFEHAALSSGIAVVCMLAGLWQLRRAVASLGRLRDELGAVRAGESRRVDSRYPIEVQPVVDGLNALLEHQERAVAGAQAKAGDLAHGLKTPLAVLVREAGRVSNAGHPDLATAIETEVDRMRRQVDFHLARARAAASGATPGARSAVLESAEGLARALDRLHDDRGVSLELKVAGEHTVRRSVRTSTRCWATSSTTRASGRERAWSSNRRDDTASSS